MDRARPLDRLLSAWVADRRRLMRHRGGMRRYDVKVVDGDTLSFEGLGVTVRLDGIDASESRQACESAEGERYECGMAATRALKEKIVDTHEF